MHLFDKTVCVCARAQVRFKKTLGAKKFNSEPNTLSLLVQSHKHLEKAMTPHSCLENPRDGGGWHAAVYGVTQSRTRLK